MRDVDADAEIDGDAGANVLRADIGRDAAAAALFLALAALRADAGVADPWLESSVTTTAGEQRALRRGQEWEACHAIRVKVRWPWARVPFGPHKALPDRAAREEARTVAKVCVLHAARIKRPGRLAPAGLADNPHLVVMKRHAGEPRGEGGVVAGRTDCARADRNSP
jgi:hypothetical protein